MKQVFKGKTITLNKTVKNILLTFDCADEKFVANDWYNEANKYAMYLSKTFDIKLSVACGIIAALSPLKSWNENKIISYSFIQSGSQKHTKLFISKAKAIKESNGEVDEIASILNGNKIVSFFLNILNPTDNSNVTIDRHALSIALGKNISENEGKGITLKQYQFFVNAYKVAGAKAGISPLMMQSVTWQAWRENKGIKELNEVPF